MYPKPDKREKEKDYRSYGWLKTRKLLKPKHLTLRVKRKKIPSIKKIKKQAWDAFSLFIRNRDKKCVLCNSIKGFSAGHLIPRGKSATKFDENNVFGLCSTCNFRDRFEPGYHDKYVAWYFIKFGAGRYIKLVEKSQQIKQRKRQDFEDIIKKYD